MQLELSGNVAVVTGGASGIGLACARMFAREGCLVSVWDISWITDEQKAALSLESSSPSHSVIVDLTDSRGRAALRRTEATFWGQLRTLLTQPRSDRVSLAFRSSI